MGSAGLEWGWDRIGAQRARTGLPTRCDPGRSGSRWSHLLHVFIEEIENGVSVPQLPPLLHMLVPRPVGHWGRGQGRDSGLVNASCASQVWPSPSCRLRPTFPIHEVLQEAVPGAWIGVQPGHVVEVIIGDNHILCISGNIDHLQGQTIPSSGSLSCFPVTLHRTK